MVVEFFHDQISMNVADLGSNQQPIDSHSDSLPTALGSPAVIIGIFTKKLGVQPKI